MMPKRVIILGGDGFCGWPTALFLSHHGYEVVIVDNLSRRKIDIELGCDSLTPISSIFKRIMRWEELTSKKIVFYNFDVARNYHRLLTLIKAFEPDTIVHFAEQRAAPYSMKSSFHKRYTVDNNLNGTNNLLAAIVESKLDVHTVHLGTMGVYGYQTVGLQIPEGYLKVMVETNQGLKELDILYPASPGSIYHMTKTQDALMFYFYNKNDGLRITDLHQGVVWGIATDETDMDEMLVNRFDYDGDYGTVLNRFLVQAVVGHPLTVHGSGGQTRAFIHIRDTIKCIKLAIDNPPKFGARVEIFNQATETHSIRYLASLVSEATGAKIRYFRNPRKEAPENDLMVKNEKFLQLGLNPVKLKNGLMADVIQLADKYKDRCDKSRIICTSCWCGDMEADCEGIEDANENHPL